MSTALDCRNDRIRPNHSYLMSSPKAILVDLDDTILALSDTAGPAWRATCARFAARLEGATEQEMVDAIGMLKLLTQGERSMEDGDVLSHEDAISSARLAIEPH